jgi:flagellar hook-basal body complex protein FliE
VKNLSEFPVITRYEVVGAEDVIRTNAQLWQSYKQGGMSVQDFTAATKENMEGTYAMRRAYSGMRMALRTEMAPLLESAKVLNDLGRIGRDVVQMWQAYTLGQLRIERAARDAVDAQSEVAEWQKLYNQYLRDFGADSAFTKDASDNLTEAYKHLKDAQDAAAKAQQDMTVGYVGMVLESASVVSSVISLITHVKMLQATLASTSGEAGLGALIKGLTGASLAATESVTAFAAAGESMSMLGFGAAGTAAGLLAPLAVVLPPLLLDFAGRQEKALEENPTLREMQKQIRAGGAMAMGGNPYYKGEGQHGIDYIYDAGYYRLHKGERVLNAEQTRRNVLGATRPIQATVTQYNTITQQADAEAAADRAFRKFLKKCADKT